MQAIAVLVPDEEEEKIDSQPAIEQRIFPLFNCLLGRQGRQPTVNLEVSCVLFKSEKET